MTHKLLAAGSVALLGSSALIGASGTANADSAEDCGIDPEFTMPFVIGDICMVPIWAAGEFTFTAPDGVETVEAILIGGGAGASSLAYGYGGGAGEVVFVDTLDASEEVLLTLGAGGSAGENGEASTLEQGALSVTADGGNGTTSGSGELGATASADGNSVFGGGSSGPATATAPGGGYFLDEVELVGADNPLWPTDPEASEVAVGGSVTVDDQIYTPGDGGDSVYNGSIWVNNSGQDGAVVFAYRASEVADAEPLAATGVDANTIGVTAGLLGTAGVGLAVLAAARRARREK